MRCDKIKLKCVNKNSCSADLQIAFEQCHSACVIQDITVNKDDIVDYYNEPRYAEDNDFVEIEERVYDQYLSIHFYNAQIYTIPNGTFRLMPNIRTFNGSFTDLELLNEHEFQFANELRKIILNHNQLTYLPGFLFPSSRILFFIDLSNNKIADINVNAFANADHIEHLYLSYNRIERLDREIFENLKQLRFLYLDHNQVKIIDSSLFVKNTLLSQIDLVNNQIEVINCSSIARSSFHTNLYMDNNPLEYVDERCFTRVNDQNGHSHQLHSIFDANEIYISNTSVTKVIIPESEKYSTRKMTMDDSIADNLHLFLSHFEDLQYLSLKNTKIGPLNITTFAKQTKLSTLYLRNCSLGHLTYGTFSHQNELKLLDISYNNLMQIDFHIFLPMLRNIEQLYLDGNNLTQIDNLTTNNFVSLSVLGITDNNFQCSYIVNKIIEFDVKRIHIKIAKDSTELNITHVKGITCDQNDSFIEEYSENESNNSYKHISSTAKWLFEVITVAMCSALITFNVTVYLLKRKYKHMKFGRTTSEQILMLNIDN